MALTAEQLTQVRLWIPWNPPTDLTLQARSDELGNDSVWPVVLEQLNAAISTLADPTKPLQFTIPGDWSQNAGGNLEALERRLKAAEDAQRAEALAGTSGIGVSRLVRRNPYVFRAI